MNVSSRGTRTIRAAALAAVLVAPVALAGEASADAFVSNNCAVANNSDCQAGVNVLYVHYNSVDANGYTSSAYGKFLGYVPDYAGYGSTTYIFAGGGNGTNQVVKNNAASVLACSSEANYRVYFNSNKGGHSQYISGDWGCNNGVNLDSTLKNDNGSQAWG